MNIIINAGGLNTRFEEYSIFHKIFLPFENNDSILGNLKKNIISDNPLDWFIIINEKYFKQAIDFIKANNLDIKIICSTNTNGSYNTIKEVISYLPTENLFFIWSDLYFNEKIKIDQSNLINKAIVFTNYGDYRFEIKNKKLFKSNNGNVPGIYFLKNNDIFINQQEKDNQDLVEKIFEIYENNDIKIDELGIELLEIKDKKIYFNLLKNCYNDNSNRFFNQIKFYDLFVHKAAVDVNYENLIQKEINWYMTVCDYDLNQYIPKIFSTGSMGFNMEYLKDYKTVYNQIIENPDKKVEIINQVINSINQFHLIGRTEKKETIENDIKFEFFDKVKNRVLSVKNLIVDFNSQDFEIIEQSYSFLRKKFENNSNYSLIHGDLNGSNMMMSNDFKSIKFIDPRGYFGNSKNFGLMEYDYAKILYLCYGYDDFNINSNYTFLNKNDYKKPIQLFTDNEINFIFSKLDINYKVLMVMLGFIWICLSSYIVNNIFKVNISYYYGLEILKGAMELE